MLSPKSYKRMSHSAFICLYVLAWKSENEFDENPFLLIHTSKAVHRLSAYRRRAASSTSAEPFIAGQNHRSHSEAGTFHFTSTHLNKLRRSTLPKNASWLLFHSTIRKRCWSNAGKAARKNAIGFYFLVDPKKRRCGTIQIMFKFQTSMDQYNRTTANNNSNADDESKEFSESDKMWTTKSRGARSTFFSTARTLFSSKRHNAMDSNGIHMNYYDF